MKIHMSDFKPGSTSKPSSKLNGKTRSLLNETALLSCLKSQGWIRESEAALIIDMSPNSLGKVCRKLASNGEIFRDRPLGDAGMFLKLQTPGANRVNGKSGKDVEIPKSWAHDALAIQSLYLLSKHLGCGFETESALRRLIQSNKDEKLPDGRLVADATYHFEQELSRKSGPHLRKQSETICQLASSGTTCYISYPFPPSVCKDTGEDDVSHEVRLTNSIRQIWGDDDAPNVKLVRCCFISSAMYQNMHVDHIEIIDIPPIFKTTSSQRFIQETEHEVPLINWDMYEDPRDFKTIPRRIEVQLIYNGEVFFEGVFFESPSPDQPHRLYLNWSKGIQAESDLDQPFDEFVNAQKKLLEIEAKKNFEGELLMLSMQ